MLPKPPRKADDEIAGGEDEEDMAAIDDPASPGKVQQRKREEHLMLVLWLAGASAVMFLCADLSPNFAELCRILRRPNFAHLLCTVLTISDAGYFRKF